MKPHIKLNIMRTTRNFDQCEKKKLSMQLRYGERERERERKREREN